MFRRLTDFGHTRSWVEALGFYLVYTVVGVIAIGALAWATSLVNGDFGFEGGLALGASAASGVSLVLSYSILRAKGLLGNVAYLAVAVLSVLGSVAAGLILGLIFVAFLTTRRPESAAQVATA
jgi:hypothetical protein